MVKAGVVKGNLITLNRDSHYLLVVKAMLMWERVRKPTPTKFGAYMLSSISRALFLMKA
jgi:hypothetical protein